MGIVISGGLVARPGKAEVQDIRLEGEMVSHIAPRIEPVPGDRVVDARDLAVVPGLANGHAHSPMTLLRGIGEDMELMPWLTTAVWPVEARMDDEDVYWGLRLAALEMLKTGTTLCNEMYLHPEALARAAKDSGMRFVLSYALIDGLDGAVAKAQRSACEAFFSRLPDCGPLSRFGLAAHSVYATHPDSIAFLGELSAAKDLPLHVHLAETKTEHEDCLRQRGMSPTAWLDKLGALGPRTVAAHCLHLGQSDWDLIAARGAVVVHNPVSNMKLASGPAFDWEAARRRGIRVLVGTDGAASNNSLDLYADLKIAGLLQKQGYADSRRAPVAELLAAATTAGHDYFGTGAGRIEVGAAADLVLIDLSRPGMTPIHDLGANLVYAGAGAAVHTVFCAGRTVMRAGRVEAEDAILAEAAKRARRLAKA